MIRQILRSLIILFTYSCTSSCDGDNTDSSKQQVDNRRTVCSEKSIWRDKNGIDSCSFYTKEETCEKIIGKLSIISRLHKGLLEKDIFEGGMSSRWFEIEKDSIKYFKPSGEIADRGTCNCNNGILAIDWETGDGLPKECEIYFNSNQSVELRYYDYPYNFNTFEFDTTKAPKNPTKILGNMTE
jgi:hypothetical protein